MATEEIIAYWLCPAEPARSQFAQLIQDLAARFDAPVFEPHVTVYVASAEHENPKAVWKECEPFRLAVRRINSSDEFTKTLFVEFTAHARLAALTEAFRRASFSPSDYELNPHLSLIYKEMDPEAKRELAASIVLPFEEAVFDTVKAIISPAKIRSRKDVEAWRVIAERHLSK